MFRFTGHQSNKPEFHPFRVSNRMRKSRITILALVGAVLAAVMGWRLVQPSHELMREAGRPGGRM